MANKLCARCGSEIRGNYGSICENCWADNYIYALTQGSNRGLFFGPRKPPRLPDDQEDPGFENIMRSYEDERCGTAG